MKDIKKDLTMGLISTIILVIILYVSLLFLSDVPIKEKLSIEDEEKLSLAKTRCEAMCILEENFTQKVDEQTEYLCKVSEKLNEENTIYLSNKCKVI